MSVLITSTPIAPPLALGTAGKSRPPVVAQIAALRPYRLSVEQFEAMIKAGIVGKYDRCELIRGELIEKMTIGDSHVAAVRRLNRLLQRAPEDQFIVGVQDPIKLADSRPEPDISLLQHRDDFYANGTAGPANILLLIEVADVSLTYDRKVKLPLYAENGIQEYWIVNLIDDCIEVHRQPQGLDYADRRVISRGQSIAPLALPQMSLTTDAILGPAGQTKGSER
jgi:Uma2 family endonuclease